MSEGDELLVTRWLTVPGRLLLIGTICAFTALFVWYFMGSVPGLRPGRYPLLLWWLPVLVAAVAFFVISAWLLERLGVTVYRRSLGSEPPRDSDSVE